MVLAQTTGSFLGIILLEERVFYYPEYVFYAARCSDYIKSKELRQLKRVLILANHFITLYAFRREIIQKLIKIGYEVYISLPRSSKNIYFEKLGCKVIPTKIARRSINPVGDVKLILFYRKLFLSIKPDVILSYTIKPNIYGSIVSNSLNITQICNITGTGGLFLKKSFLSALCTVLYRHSVRNCKKVFFQNKDDFEFFAKNRMIADNGEVIPGSGCNVERFALSHMPNGKNVNFIFAGRIMKNKGIEEYLQCAERIKKKHPDINFYIAGWFEEKKYKGIVEDYQRRGIVKYCGFTEDIRELMGRCHCAVLPSHGGEGVPNVLLEAAAMGRICVSSDISGARDAVVGGENGFLFEVGNADSLAEAVEKVILLTDAQRDEMGRNGREKVEKLFDRRIVINKYLDEVKDSEQICKSGGGAADRSGQRFADKAISF